MAVKVFDLQLSPFTYRISTSYPPLFSQLQCLYPDSVLGEVDSNQIIDYEINFKTPTLSLSRALAFQLGDKHFRFAEKQGLVPTFEWGLNWCVGNFQNRYLCIHAAVLEKNGFSVVLPAPPGSGKSTLCAMLMFAGWRLLSDEHCLVDIYTGMIVPCVRPISLKNTSINVVNQLYPEVEICHITQDTHKGTIGYVAPSDISWQHRVEQVKPYLVVFPKYSKDQQQLAVTPLLQHETFMLLAENSFNYSVLGPVGFEVMANFIREVKGFKICYNNGAEAIAMLEEQCH